MKELRLVPSAVVVWAVVLSVLITRTWMIAFLLTGCAVVVAGALRHGGQAMTAGVFGAVATAVAQLRVLQVDQVMLGSPVSGRVGSWRAIDDQTSILRLNVSGYPAQVPVLARGDPTAPVGAVVEVQGTIGDSDRPGLGDVLVNAREIATIADASGPAVWANHVRETFLRSVGEHVGPSSQGLIPGMVLGDTRLQEEAEQQLYIDTGLSHLSAVSGANVAIVTTVAVLVVRLASLGPRSQVVAACGALAAFVVLVGTEPSVLRASVTGLVGLLAVLNSSRMEPVHGLCLAVIGLLIWDSDLAANYGFALSVAATAGIVALHPLLYRAIAPTGLPDILVRAIAVAVAADVVTLPIIAMMAGRVPLVSVLANVLAAPAVAPVTVIGLIAAGLALLPGRVEVIAYWLIEPCTWWIHNVATWCAGLPAATIPVMGGWLGPAWVVVIYCWLIVAVVKGHPWKVAGAIAIATALSFHQARLPPQVDITTLRHEVVDDVSGIDEVPAGTQVIIVRDGSGREMNRPTVTDDGVPVLFPYRDGPVTVHIDGTQHAVDGRF